MISFYLYIVAQKQYKWTSNSLYCLMQKYFAADYKFQIGIDEAGRGPLLGRVYAAAVLLPNGEDAEFVFAYEKMKDSKKFSSQKKLREVAQHIRDNALFYHIAWRDEAHVDKHNILQATKHCMHEAAMKCLERINATDTILLVDGTHFEPILMPCGPKFVKVAYETIPKGDNTYASIAAASILAKCARDDYIEELCNGHPELIEKYNIKKNKGYGTKYHMEGLQKYGTSQWHRMSFAPCSRTI
jgi:ribonuclease HII